MNSVCSSGKTFAPSTHIKVVNASRRLDVDLNPVGLMIGTLGPAVDPGIQDAPHEWRAHKAIVEPIIFSKAVLNVVGYELSNRYSRCRRSIARDDSDLHENSARNGRR